MTGGDALDLAGLVVLNGFIWPQVVGRLLFVPGSVNHTACRLAAAWMRPFVPPAIVVIWVCGDPGSWFVAGLSLALFLVSGDDDDHKPWSRLGKRLHQHLFPRTLKPAFGGV